jgi:alpha-N-arabinofuranosidase
MFSNNLGSEVLGSSLAGAGPLFFYSVTRDTAKRMLYVKIVNASSKPQSLDFEFPGGDQLAGTGTIISLRGNSMEETNSSERSGSDRSDEEHAHGSVRELPSYVSGILD